MFWIFLGIICWFIAAVVIDLQLDKIGFAKAVGIVLSFLMCAALGPVSIVFIILALALNHRA